MKITKLLICTTSLLTVFSGEALALQRVENQKVYKEDFDPYQHPRSLTDFMERERLRKLAEAQAAQPAPPPPMPQYQPQAMQNIAPNPDEIYTEPSLQARRPVNVHGTSMMAMQNRYAPTPIMTQDMAMAPMAPVAAPMPLVPVGAPVYRGELEEVEEDRDRDLFASGVTITPKIGTQGIGLELGAGFNEYIGARIGANYATYSDGDSINDIDYDYDINIMNGNALLDVHPFANGFRMTGGAYFQPDEVEFKATPTISKSIGGTTYTASEIGTITGKVETGDISPYAGIGFSRAFTKSGDWFFDADLGVKFNDVTTDIRSNGTLAGDPTFDADLQREKQKVQDEFDALELYPVVSVGFGYKF